MAVVSLEARKFSFFFQGEVRGGRAPRDLPRKGCEVSALEKRVESEFILKLMG